MPFLFIVIQALALLGVVTQPAGQPKQTPPAQTPPAPAQPDPNQTPQSIEVQTPPIEIKVRDPNAPAKPTVPGQINNADDLLLALENADADLRTLSADLRYDRTFEIAGDRQVREGKLHFISRPAADPKADPNAPARNDRKFSITFTKLIVGPRVRDAKDDPSVMKEYIFDGEWLVEKLPGESPKLFTKRQVVAPGERFDPLRIGEGPMPIPIGQRRQDILDRYSAQLVSADADLDDPDLKKFVADSYQLKLVPRPERMDEDEFREIRLWYRRGAPNAAGKKPDAKAEPGALLPRMARTINRSGDESIVQLINVQLNKPIPDTAMDTRTPGPKDGWDIQIIPFRQGIKDEPPASPGNPGAAPR